MQEFPNILTFDDAGVWFWWLILSIWAASQSATCPTFEIFSGRDWTLVQVPIERPQKREWELDAQTWKLFTRCVFKGRMFFYFLLGFSNAGSHSSGSEGTGQVSPEEFIQPLSRWVHESKIHGCMACDKPLKRQDVGRPYQVPKTTKTTKSQQILRKWVPWFRGGSIETLRYAHNHPCKRCFWWMCHSCSMLQWGNLKWSGPTQKYSPRLSTFIVQPTPPVISSLSCAPRTANRFVKYNVMRTMHQNDEHPDWLCWKDHMGDMNFITAAVFQWIGTYRATAATVLFANVFSLLPDWLVLWVFSWGFQLCSGCFLATLGCLLPLGGKRVDGCHVARLRAFTSAKFATWRDMLRCVGSQTCSQIFEDVLSAQLQRPPRLFDKDCKRWKLKRSIGEKWNLKLLKNWKDKAAQHKGAMHSSLFVLLPVFSRIPLSLFKILKESICLTLYLSNLSFHLDSLFPQAMVSLVSLVFPGFPVFSCFFSRSPARIASSLGIPLETAPGPRLCTFQV